MEEGVFYQMLQILNLLIEYHRFVFGWKDQFGSPEGFFDAAAANDEFDGNVIYVSIAAIHVLGIYH